MFSSTRDSEEKIAGTSKDHLLRIEDKFKGLLRKNGLGKNQDFKISTLASDK